MTEEKGLDGGSKKGNVAESLTCPGFGIQVHKRGPHQHGSLLAAAAFALGSGWQCARLNGVLLLSLFSFSLIFFLSLGLALPCSFPIFLFPLSLAPVVSRKSKGNNYEIREK
jgi:hypothetical protein